MSRACQRLDNTKTWATYDSATVRISESGIVKALITDRSIVLPQGTRIVFPSGYTEHGLRSEDQDGRRDAKLSKLNCCTVKSLESALANYKNKRYDKVKVYTEGTQYVISDA